MPLKRGYGKKTIEENIRILVSEGRSRRQATAIALSEAEKYKPKGKK